MSGAVWSSILDRLDDVAAAKLDREQLRVKVETDLGTSTIVYDPDAPESKSGTNPLMPKYYISIVNGEGDTVTDWGEPVKFNWIKGGIVYGGLALVTITLIKGIKGFIK